MERPADLEARMERIVRDGLPCRLWVVTKPWGWSCIEVEPLEGFTHLCTPEQLAEFRASGWNYHVTLGNNIPPEALAAVASQWHGLETVVAIWKVNDWSCVARLDAKGVGGCPCVLKAIELGDPDRVWFGPHISM